MYCMVVFPILRCNISIDMYHMGNHYLQYRLCAGTTNPGGTRKPDNPLKGIRNTIPWNPNNPIKGIRDIVQNRTRIQWPRGATVPTMG